MARRKTKTTTKFSSLALGFILCHLINIDAFSQDHHLGKVTQSSGEITYFNYLPPRKTVEIKKDSKIKTGGSYLTRDSSFFTAKLFDGSWLKASPRSKFSLEFAPDPKVLTIHLFSGSVKILFSSKINKKQITKLVIKSADASFETVEAKLSVVRNILTSNTTLYVEKGLVTAQMLPESSNHSVLIHTNEMTSLADRSKGFDTVRQISTKEFKFLNSRIYIDNKNTDSME